MNYNEFLERIKELDFEELREGQPEYMEFVIATNHLNRLSSILESYYGAAYASPEEQPSKQAQKYADPYGGIRKGQTLYYLRFFSNLVVESLIDFQRKVAQIMEPICFTLNDFNLIVYPLQLSSMDGIFTMI